MREFYEIFAREIKKIPEFYIIFARKCPNFNDICPKMPEFYMTLAKKIFSWNFFWRWDFLPPPFVF